MDLRIEPCKLTGTIKLPQSKSVALRAMLCSYLYRGVRPDIEPFCDDVAVMAEAIDVLADGGSVIDCRDCAAALRFLVPVCAALGREMEFKGSAGLAKRPIGELLQVLAAHGAQFSSEKLPFTLSGKLRPGTYRIAGNISSQYISGLLMAFPLVRGDCEIMLTTALESSGYVDLTQYIIGKKGDVPMEPDAGSAALYAVANFLGGSVDYGKLPKETLQPDGLIEKQLEGIGGKIDVSQTPDLAPILAVAALGRDAVTELTGCVRLQFKESNRIESIMDMIASLGGRAYAKGGTITIYGTGRLTGGIVDTKKDHRIAMAAAIAAAICNRQVCVKNAECVSKSYPGFFEDYKSLEGRIHGR